MRESPGPLPSRFNYLIPELALVEACTAERGSPVQFARKLLRFLKQNQPRTFLASHLGHMLQVETEPGRLADRYLIAYIPFFETYADACSVDESGLEARVEAISKAEHPYVAIQREFERGRSQFAASLFDKAEGRRIISRAGLDTLDEWLVQPGTVAKWVTLFNERYTSQEWRQALEVFPDRHAAGRWWRSALWYWIREARGIGPKRLRNDWWDSIYVFTASYCDEFWTTDREAGNLVRLLFPATHVPTLTPDQVRERH